MIPNIHGKFLVAFLLMATYQFCHAQNPPVTQTDVWTYNYNWNNNNKDETSTKSTGSASWQIGNQATPPGCLFGVCLPPQPVAVPTAVQDIQRPPCFCRPQVCNGCAPWAINPLAVFGGQPKQAQEPLELVQGCNREMPCIETSPCSNCNPGVHPYDQCICYGPGVCVCFLYQAQVVVPGMQAPGMAPGAHVQGVPGMQMQGNIPNQALSPWQSKPPCFCQPAICQNCIDIEPVSVIQGIVDYGDQRAVSVSHGCDWNLKCEPTPACPVCNTKQYDQCICYGRHLCTCWFAPVKPPCYCTAAVCNKCYVGPGFPAQIIDNRGQSSHKPITIATGCDPTQPCWSKPDCRGCTKNDLKFESCVYFGPGLNACFKGRAGYYG